MIFTGWIQVVKNIAKAVVAVIEIFEQQGGISMKIIKMFKITCQVVGGIAGIISILRD